MACSMLTAMVYITMLSFEDNDIWEVSCVNTYCSAE